VQGLSRLGVGQRRFIFFLFIIGGLLLILALALLLYSSTVNSGRSVPIALVPEVSVSTAAELPDRDAFPAAVAAAADGTAFTGSFATGAVWRIDPDGTVTELPDTRDLIGSVTALAPASDGTLFVLDGGDTDPRTSGGIIWRIGADGTLSSYGALPEERSFIAPNDMVVSANGVLFVTDPGQNLILRFGPDDEDEDTVSNGVAWWLPSTYGNSQPGAITGIALDPTSDRHLIVTDPELNRIYRVSFSGDEAILYDHGNQPNPPGFDGVVMTPDGSIYVAALGQNGVARVNAETGSLDYIAGLFRGSSDVDYDPAGGRLLVTNWDQSSLVLPLLSPSLPFTIDAITFNAEARPEATVTP
jgi:sugar lactone lactonase YvrE